MQHDIVNNLSLSLIRRLFHRMNNGDQLSAGVVEVIRLVYKEMSWPKGAFHVKFRRLIIISMYNNRRPLPLSFVFPPPPLHWSPILLQLAFYTLFSRGSSAVFRSLTHSLETHIWSDRQILLFYIILFFTALFVHPPVTKYLVDWLLYWPPKNTQPSVSTPSFAHSSL